MSSSDIKQPAAPTTTAPSPPRTHQGDLPAFHAALHRQYILKVSKDRDSFEYLLTEHLRMSGVYWGLMGMVLMGRDVRAEMGGAGQLADWVMRCYSTEGGFGGGRGTIPTSCTH